MIPDGTYDAFVVDAASGTGDDDGTSRMHLELTILTGPHKGEVVAMTATGLAGDELDLLGMPATLTVSQGRPAVRVEG